MFLHLEVHFVHLKGVMRSIDMIVEENILRQKGVLGWLLMTESYNLFGEAYEILMGKNYGDNSNGSLWRDASSDVTKIK